MLAWSTNLSRGESLEWLGDLQAAKDKAKQENKFILLYFTGSDWCSWCMKLKREVFDAPEFIEFARMNLVLVELDFPRNKPMAHLQLQGNIALQKSYRVTEYPTVILVKQDGQEFNRSGYVAGGPARFIPQIGLVRGPIRIYPSAPAAPPPNEPDPIRKPVAFRPVPPATPIHYGHLALKAISGPKSRRIVLINNASMMTGETTKVKVEDHDVVVCCKEIRDDSVVITCDGAQMELKLGTH